MELEEYFRKILSNTLQPLLQEIWRGNVNQSTRELEALRRRVKESMPENPASCGWKAFSQNDEDGIIQECLRRLSLSFPLSHTFIEFCCGNGLENCTHNLLINGYRGVWLDGDPANQAFIKNGLVFLKNETLWVRDDFLTLQNIEHILKESIEFLNEKNIDVFVLDIDGNDIYFAEVIQRIIAPKLFVVEYLSLIHIWHDRDRAPGRESRFRYHPRSPPGVEYGGNGAGGGRHSHRVQNRPRLY